MRKSRTPMLAVVFVCLGSCAVAAESAKITIDVSKQGSAVPRGLYGIFFEEINHAEDGGLYAELVNNRGFEDANLPPACRLQGSFVVPPRTPHFWKRPEASDWQMPWNVDSKWPGWTMEVSGGSDAGFRLVEDNPLGAAAWRRVQWNLGGWGNYQHAVETDDSIVGTPVVARIEAGRWCDAMLEVQERRIRCLLDGALFSEFTLPRPETVLAVAGAGAESGDVILKILNTTPETVETSVRLDGVTHVAPEGGLTVLTSDNVTDENSFEEPTKIVPVSRSVPTGNPSTVSSAPHSLNILRLHIKEKTQ